MYWWMVDGARLDRNRRRGSGDGGAGMEAGRVSEKKGESADWCRWPPCGDDSVDILMCCRGHCNLLVT